MPIVNKPDSTFLDSMESAAKYNMSPEQNDSFWFHDEDIDAIRWNQAFPYQFILVEKVGDGYIQTASEQSKNQAKNWVFTLPFPPESMSIGMPFAISGAVTQGGYIEEHGGAPIRNITLSGSLGVLPLRPTAKTRNTQNFGASIFAGTIQQAQQVATSARNLASNVSGSNSNFVPNLLTDEDFDATNPNNIARATGYYQMRLLQQFFENYVSFKKTEEGRDFRLAFCIWKQQAVYLVTPVNFTTNFSANSPLEPMYNMQLRAWRRIELDHSMDVASKVIKPPTRNPNKLARMLKAILDARDVLENARDVIEAVGRDIDQALFEPLRQITLLAKDLLSIPLAFADLPVQILNSTEDIVAKSIATAIAFEGFGEKISADFAGEDENGVGGRILEAAKAVGKAATYPAEGVGGRPGPTVGVLRQEVNQGKDPALDSRKNSDPALDVFRNPGSYYGLFKNLRPSSMNLPPKVIRAIGAERAAVRALKRLDFEDMRDGVAQVAADFSEAVGAGNATFNATYQRANRPNTKTASPSDFRIMFALNRVIMEMNRLAAYGDINQTRLKSIDFVAGLASRSGIAFTTPRSKYSVPFPYGVSLEQLSNRYLGDPDRWLEIATLNGLRAPYVDEEGFDLPLLTNGFGNQVNVSNVDHLYVGQQVSISASTTTRTTRHITKIDRVSVGNNIVTVDGDPTMDAYTTMAGAALHAFLPDTVNSQMMIYIPSDQESVDEDFQTKAIPGINDYDQLLNVGGVDLLLTSNNDLAITPDGDCRFAVGMTNIVQIARIRLSVVQGTLNRHPSFGLPIKVGQSTADVSAQDLLKAVKNLFADDSMFTGVTSASVQKKGQTVSIGMAVGVRGHSQVVPITFEIGN